MDETQSSSTPSQGDSRSSASTGDVQWERTVIEQLASAGLKEQRRARRWGIFFKGAFLACVTFFLLAHFLVNNDWRTANVRHSALITINGEIMPEEDASADNVIIALQRAFADHRTAGVILRINSPGGSPVQASYISDEIVRLRSRHPDIPLYAVITDICASGGYFIAAAADRIFANRSSIVGSIGVLMNGFGFVEAMKKLGIERRLITAGEHKGLLDPFSPIDSRQLVHLRSVLKEIHQQFIDAVKKGRGDRIKESEKLFSGLVWTGEQSIELGLVDGFGTARSVAREHIGEETLVDFTTRVDFVERVVERIGIALGRGVATVLGSRFGVGL